MNAFLQFQKKYADSDSRFFESGGFRVHYKVFGKGEPLIVLLHGSFLSIRSWRDVVAPLSEKTTVLVFDRPAFGLTSRPVPSPENDVRYSPEAQSDLVVRLIEEVGHEKAILVGNSTGGTLALLVALRHPRQVQGLVLVGAMVYSGYATSEVPAFLKPLLTGMSPVFSRLMKFLITKLYDRNIRGFWYNKALLSDETLAAFRKDLMIGDWSRAFWELFLETHHLGLEKKLGNLEVPSLVITGEHDLTVKTEESFKLAREIPGAELEVIPNCGHLPQEEVPEAFVAAVMLFLEKSMKML
ncbi:alpha/beta fold hydrolase [Prosthecochloris sp. SCSIO W1103]|uniref:alpha/beta fold hydrolase n=1 Tax=Prosthecochloris sp. SCSIO W1103 TaxID=2992244 RepID=UPI00223E31FC|nr:alpha/beta hydrolase [Prosthecochloris sp. SCSIO W1103]UZJ36415.1 alpha/beta hydrolase [Prosthecochloris sp. SCSIO W1103]